VLIVVEPTSHPVLKRLSSQALEAWHVAVGRCDLFRTDIVDAHELLDVSDRIVDEWEQLAIARRLPFGHVRILGRGRLWEYGRDDYSRRALHHAA